jgi:hypothetical protein
MNAGLAMRGAQGACMDAQAWPRRMHKGEFADLGHARQSSSSFSARSTLPCSGNQTGWDATVPTIVPRPRLQHNMRQLWHNQLLLQQEAASRWREGNAKAELAHLHAPERMGSH